MNIVTNLGHGQKGNKILLLYVQKREIDVMVGRNLKRLRIHSGMTQEGLAEKLNITSSGLIPQWESGVKGIGKNVLEKLCVIFNVRPYEFYIEDKTPLITDEDEKDLLITFREAKELGGAVAEKIPEFGRFIITQTKKSKRTGTGKGKKTRHKTG